MKRAPTPNQENVNTEHMLLAYNVSEDGCETIFLNDFVHDLRWLKWRLAQGINFGYMMAAALQIYTLSSPTSLMKTGTDSFGSCSQVVTEHLWLWTQLCWDPAMASNSRFALVRKKIVITTKSQFYWHGLNFIPAWIIIYTRYKMWDEINNHSQTSMVKPLKFGN